MMLQTVQILTRNLASNPQVIIQDRAHIELETLIMDQNFKNNSTNSAVPLKPKCFSALKVDS